MLVVFGDDVILFSDKSIKFLKHRDPSVAWGRWYRHAIRESAKQLFGAERWLREHPSRVFADARCTQPLRAPLPESSHARFHLIAVAWGAGDACHEYFGPNSSKSLVVKSDLVGDAHLEEPFHIGRVDAQRTFVHVFDELTLQLLMREVDTARDFMEYLDGRAALLTTTRPIIFAPGEEELLATYLTNVDEGGTHGFLDRDAPKDLDGMMFVEGSWTSYEGNPQRLLKREANRISYIWDQLIEHLIKSFPASLTLGMDRSP